MQEMIPLLGGAIVGLIVHQLPMTRTLKIVVFVVLCLVVGAFSSWINGELEISGIFISFDALLVWLGGLIAVGLLEARRRFVTQRS